MAVAHPIAIESSSAPEDFTDWTELKARQVAANENIELGDEHWEVIYFLRNHCQNHGSTCSARLLLKSMAANFKKRGGKKYLYTLFPRGPVFQATKIAGIPLPAYTLDLSFGSVH